MSDASHSVLSLNGEWLVAAPEELVAAVEENRSPATPAPGSPPPPELTAALEKAGGGPPATRGHFRSAAREAGFRVTGITVPGCWERGALPKPYEGPVWYLRSFSAEDELRRRGRLRLEFDAVSYVATVWLNGTRIGEHRGIWDPFSFDVTDTLQAENTLAVEVYKPWELFPVRESLAGFIPYVTTTFGGIWQAVRIRAVDALELVDVFTRPYLDDQGRRWFEVSGTVRPVAAPPEVDASAAGDSAERETSERAAQERAGPERRTPVEIEAGLVGVGGSASRAGIGMDPAGSSFVLHLDADGAAAWEPGRAALAEIEVRARTGESSTGTRITSGFRTVGARGRTITLNDRPVYPRGILNWLSYPELVAPTPDQATIRREIERMQELGFNMIKLCLVVPPEEYFEIADELGMMLWLELPMWLPSVDDAYRRRAREEYRRILRRVRNHPSIVMYTLGCELSSEADAGFLRELYDLVKKETGAALVRDNSGSAEAYGGVELEFADYHDYHFYAEATVFTDLLDYFVPAWKPIKPLVFGEYCDSDTFRSVAEVKRRKGYDLYWSHDDQVRNPQGVRWDYNVVTNEERLAALPIEIPFAEIERRSRAKSLAYRKAIIEQTRVHEVTSGYVITNIRDTPITTSGMVDDFGELKFDPQAFRRFNAPTVIALQRDRRRIWRRGGDRPQHLDDRVFASGEQLRQNVVVAHPGPAIDSATLSWSLHGMDRDSGSTRGGRAAIAEGTIEVGAIRGGTPELAGAISSELPVASEPRRLALDIELVAEGNTVSANRFELWLLPDAQPDWAAVDVVDDRGLFASELSRAGRRALAWSEVAGTGADSRTGAESPTASAPASSDRPRPLIVTRWYPEMPDVVRSGRPMIILLDDTTSDLTEELPFFREAIPLVHGHPLLDSLPHDGHASSMWSGVTPDRALRQDELSNRFGATAKPLVSRLDARTSLLTHYLSEVTSGNGSADGLSGRSHGDRVFITTLALAGSFGRTPQGLRRNVLGRYLLAKMIDHLR